MSNVLTKLWTCGAPRRSINPLRAPTKDCDLDYPFHDKIIVVTRCGRICLGRKKINFSTVFAGKAVGIKEVHDGIWLVSFMDYDLGYFDLETRVLEPLENPFGPKVLPMS
jgi:putative transposase